MILTRKGYFPIQNLQDQEVEIWDGNEWNRVLVKQTAVRRHLITIIFSNGTTLTCTPDHQLININDKYIPTQYLIPGTKLKQGELPIIDGDEPFAHPYLHGALCAFGCFTDNGPVMDIMGPSLSNILSQPDMIDKSFPDNLPPPFLVPINSSTEIKIKWLSGFLQTRSFSNSQGISIININDKLLYDIQLMLTTLGVNSIIRRRKITKIPLPESKSITINNFELIIEEDGIVKLNSLSLTDICEISSFEPRSDLIVTDIIDIGRLSPTYSFSGNTGIFNGILAGALQLS